MTKQKELLLYIVFGVLTTVVNIVVYAVCLKWMDMDYKLSTTVAWVVSVFFAYITNKLYVFQSKQRNVTGVVKEIAAFFSFRLLSYVLDVVTLIILIDLLHINDIIAKIMVNILVIVFNYVASKVFIFVKKS